MNTERPEDPKSSADPEDPEDPRNAADPKNSTAPGNPEHPKNSADPGAPEHPERAEGVSGRRRTPLAVVSVAAAVLLVGGGGAYLAAGGGPGGRTDAGASGGGGTPPPLVLDGWAESGTAGIAPGEPDPYGATYTAPGKLPDGPGSAAVYAPRGRVGADAVARLAEALGVDGTPVAQGEGWRVGGKDGSGPALRVSGDAPGSWTFSRYTPGTDDCAKVAVCVQDPGAPAGAPVSAAAATRAAAPVLKALGQDGAKTDASQVMGARRVVNADPVVGGLPTSGWTTGLTFDTQGSVVGGHGLLGTPVEGASYPVLGAHKTLALMNAAQRHGHRMGIGGCARPVPLKDRLEQPCNASPAAPPAGTATVDKAVFGLAARSVAGRQTLVPSWLFEVRGPSARDAFTVTYPAVDPAYLASPSPAASAPAPEPTPSSPKTHTKTREVKVDGYTADDGKLTVSFMGGVCADYAVSVRESPRQVTVAVTEKPWPDKVCILIAKQYVRTVRLDAPLGGRTVAGTDGTPVPRTKPGALRPQSAAR
ncbi:hypothetical protein ACGFYV_22530 [Streptomyces sp. NPDC048297]|uniref:hypothetical protein n=1 Tax=Streptomyces sp. NPDC048297 TaxID=3365531 RepID=UPI0037233B99